MYVTYSMICASIVKIRYLVCSKKRTDIGISAFRDSIPVPSNLLLVGSQTIACFSVLMLVMLLFTLLFVNFIC